MSRFYAKKGELVYGQTWRRDDLDGSRIEASAADDGSDHPGKVRRQGVVAYAFIVMSFLIEDPLMGLAITGVEELFFRQVPPFNDRHIDPMLQRIAFEGERGACG